MGEPLPVRVALGTMHGKERAIGPALERLGIGLELARMDTDRFGTFSGDVPRQGSMVEAARAKARAACAATGLEVALASEGAYGPHPVIPFVPLGHEILLWHDGRSGREIVEYMADTTPNYDHCRAPRLADAEAFLGRIGFPETAVIVLDEASARPLAKGLQDREELGAVLERAARERAPALVQTDMRAHLNPRRMGVIAELALRLARRLETRCPSCEAPGFGHLRSLPGLRCIGCGTETALPAVDISGCTLCGHEIRTDRRPGADPAQCPYCNP